MSEENKPLLQPGVKHTADNTTVLDNTELKSPVLSDLPEDFDGGMLNVFLGTGKEAYLRMEKLMELWLDYNFTKNDENAKPSRLEASKVSLSEYIKEEFSGMSEEEVNGIANRFYNFMQQMTETEYYRNDLMRSEKWRNLTQINSNETSADVKPLKPGLNAKVSMAEAMRRGSRRASGDAENISIYLRNSFIHLRIARPTTLELGRLIQNINDEIRGYVRRVNASSSTLARIAIIRVVWRFIADRIKWCSVKDTSDYYSLVNNIRFSDVGSLAMGLMEAVSPRGVDMSLEHHTKTCNWVSYKKVDAALLTNHVDDNLKKEQAAALGNLFNMVQLYSREEITALQNMTDHNVDMKIVSADGTKYIELRDPLLGDCFTQLDAFIARINPSIQELRANFINDEQYEAELSNLIGSVTSSEYVHWIDKIGFYPEDGSDEPPTVYTRESNPVEFAEGIIDNINDDQSLGEELIRRVRRNLAKMSFTVIGVPNFTCERCKQDTSKDFTTIHGITPIDPLLAFFTHTQLTIMGTIKRLSSKAEEAI